MSETTPDPERLRETVQRSYERVAANDHDGLLALFAADIVYDRPGQESIVGINALEEFYREERPLSDGEHDTLAVVIDGDTAAVRGTFSGRQGGERVAFGFADFHTVDTDGLISRRVTYTDRDTV